MSTVVRFYQYGPPSVLKVEDEIVGTPGPGQVRLRHEAIGVNFVDTMFRDGTFTVPLPFVPGIEGAGIVEALGPDVTGLAVGDRVGYFFAPGSYASVRLINADALIRLPDDISSERTAAILAKGLTAWMGVRALYPLKAGEKVLVQGASGGVGSLVSLWAKALGATVIGTAGSAAKLDRVAHAIDHVFLSNDPDLPSKVRAIAPDGVDVVYELVGQATFASSLASVRNGGTIVTIGAASGEPNIDKEILAVRNIHATGGGMPQYVKGPAVATATAELFDALRKGILGEIKVTRYPLTDAARAHEDIAARRRSGSPILVP
ncbi:MAG: quinone oxidoreductase [Pedosphaera sp.]|nr:quinone oxidoreductase [Pedosphaera sp.]